MSATTTPARRTSRKAAVQVGNVVPLHAPKETTEDIMKSVQDRRTQAEERLLTRLEDVASALEQRHRRKAQELVAIGVAMDAPTLSDFIEIGRRLLGQKGARQ